MMKRSMHHSLLAVMTVFLMLSAGCTKEKPAVPKAGEPVTDIDGNEYKTVQIGGQVWMAQNLDVSHYRNGDPIPQVTNEEEWVKLEIGAWCYYNNDPATGAVYGKLYNWYAVNDPRGLAPEGWHIPTDEEWVEMEKQLGMLSAEAKEVEFRGREKNVGSKLKETGTDHWKEPNSDATNETGFSALAGGYRDNDGPFCFFGKYGSFWTASKADDGKRVLFRGLTTTDPGVYRFSFNRKCGFSVRCVKDVELEE